MVHRPSARRSHDYAGDAKKRRPRSTRIRDHDGQKWPLRLAANNRAGLRPPYRVRDMEVLLTDATSALRRTPATLRSLFDGLGEAWLAADEGPGTWSTLGTLAHLVHVEPSWVDRLNHVSLYADARPFPLVDRSDHLEVFGNHMLEELLDAFEHRRNASLEAVRGLDFDTQRPGLHQELGPVRMSNLLAAWVTHDHNHIGQIVKAMAKQYRSEIGAWRVFLPIVDAD